MDKNTELLDRYIRARYSLIGIVSHEEGRVTSAIKELCDNMKLNSGKAAPRRVAEWSFTTGLTGIKDIKSLDYSEPSAVLEYISQFHLPMDGADGKKFQPATVFVLKDIHKIIEVDIRSVRFLRDIATNFETQKHNVILLSPVLNLPLDLEKQISIIDWSLPTFDELSEIVKHAETEIDGIKVSLNGKRENLIGALSGLTKTEAVNTVLAGIIKENELSMKVIPHIIQEKKQIIRKSGILEYFDTNITMTEVGGLEGLKEYAAKSRRAMTTEARNAGVDVPKGVILIGPPGTGKSLVSKAIAGGEYPLLRMDMGKLLGGGRVGEAEGNINSALKTAEAIAPCVLWLDEIEKALADNGGASDGGVMMRVLGSFLTWMQETTASVYVVATANASTLRPELLSRFDDVVFVDLPDAEAREEILRLHLEKRKVKNFKDLSQIVKATWGFSGREIEKVVKFAVKTAFFEGTSVKAKHLLDAAKGIVPTMVTKKEEIESLRTWAEKKAIKAGRPLEAKPIETAENQKMEV